MTLRIAVDVGGTFTDAVMLDDVSRRIWLAKSLTTYADPGTAIAAVTESLLSQHGRPEQVTQLVHGTTLITNSLLERKGVKTALITNTGFSDALDIRRELRYDTYDLALSYPESLVSADCRFEIDARVGPDGAEWAALDEEQVKSIAGQISEREVKSIAICLLHSPVSPQHEQTLRDALAGLLPGVSCSISAEVAGEIGEYERMSTTVANAYVQPLVEQYLNSLKLRFESLGIDARLDIMVSNGGFTSNQKAASFPIRLLESGPAGGVISAINCAAAQQVDHVLAFDMGGTTAKSCVSANGVPDITHSFEFARQKRFKKGSGFPAVVASIDLIEIGAGGGSIARINPLGLLQVGPESAGSEPGPACYGLSGQAPTVTDADLLLGYLDADEFLGGSMQLDRGKAEQALSQLGMVLDMDALTAARGIYDIVNENMAAAARTHIAEKGLDIRRFTLVATGGAGPVHGVEVARRLRIRQILCPVASGVGSCLGFLSAPARADRSWSRVETAARLDCQQLAERLAAARQEISVELQDSGLSSVDVRWQCSAEMRYQGQGASLEIPLDSQQLPDPQLLTERFLDQYRLDFGRTVPGGEPEIVTWRLAAIAGEGIHRFELSRNNEARAVQQKQRQIYVGAIDGYQQVSVYPRALLDPGASFRGPCLVTEDESTLVVAHPAEVNVLPDGTIEILLDEVAE